MSKHETGARTFNAKDAEETRKASERVVKEATKSKEAARAYLVELGTHKPNGKLTKEYGG